MIGSEEITIIVVSVLCVLIIIAAIIAVSVYFCCGHKKRRKPTRYQLPTPESTNSQSTPVHQDEPAPKPLPKVGPSGLWMSKPRMHAQGPNDAYYQLKPDAIRNDQVMMREILSTPNVSQPTSGYIYQGNLRMYHSQQLPGLVSGYGEHRGAYYNEAFIYPTYVDAGLSHRSSMRFLEASGYYAPQHLTRENHIRSSRHQGQRESSEVRVSRTSSNIRQGQRESAEARVSRNNSNVRQSNPTPSRYQPKSPQHEQRNSQSIESRSSSKDKSVSSSTVSAAETVIETPKSAAVSSATPTIEPVSSRTDRYEEARTLVAGERIAEEAIPSTSNQREPDISLGNLGSGQEQRDIPSDQQSYVDSVSDITDMESKGQKITTQAFEFLDTYISDADDDMDRPKYYPGKS